MIKTASSGSPDWADRLSPAVRIIGSALTGLLLLFTAGATVGAAVAFVEKRSIGPSGLLLLAGLLLAAVLLGWLLWQLTRPWRSPAMSGFDRRYMRMWVILVALGLPLGILLGAMGEVSGGDPADVFTNSPISPAVAIGGALLLLVLLAVSAVIYHRTIDDHEERAYLWASTLAFYFMAAALPVAWLLARGAIIAPVGIGTAMLILLAAFVIQTAAWSWFKFR